MDRRSRLTQHIVVGLIGVLLISSGAMAQGKNLADLLKATGLKYSPLEGMDDSWRVPFDAEGGKTLDVFVTYNDEKKSFALIFCTVVDRPDNTEFNRDVLASAMQLNNDYPGIKFVLDQKHGDIDCQTEVYMETITVESLGMYINLVASQADENGAELNRVAGEPAEGAVPAAPATEAGLTEPAGDAPIIRWMTSMSDARAKATAENKPLLLLFTLQGCGPCARMENETLADPRVVAAAEGFVPVKVDVEKHEDLMRQYETVTTPTLILLKTDGQEALRSVGWIAVDEMLGLMKAAVK